MSYCSLHTHCHYSYDALGTVEDWVKTAKQKGMAGLALTDHGNCASALELYYYGKKHQLPVVLGEEFYLTEDPFKKEKGKKYYHITVWVKNNEGYKNLCRLSSLAYDPDRFYYKPRIGFEDLFAHKEGLMIGSGCLAGPLSRNILDSKEDISRIYVQEFKKEFKDDYYLEIQPSIIDVEARLKMAEQGMDSVNPQEKCNRQLIEYGKEFGIPLVSTPDAHMPSLEHQKFHAVKLSLQTGGNFDFEQPYYMYDLEEFRKKYALNHPYFTDQQFKESIDSTIEVMNKAQALDLDIDNTFGVFGPLLPDYKIEEHPLYKDGDSIEALTYRIIINNGRLNLEDPVIRDRLNREFKELAFNEKINLLPYFLVLEDIVRWCRANDQMYGLGRGSAAGSLLCYGLGITSVDPIKYNLLFSRFINESRIKKGTLPDIDMDFGDPKAVKEYVTNKYGEDKVYTISTVMTFGLKSAFKDICRNKFPEMTFADANKYTRNLPDKPEGMGEQEYLEYCCEMDDNFSEFLGEHRDIFDALHFMVGQQRQRGAHAAAVCISPVPLSDIIPTFINKDTKLTQYDHSWCEKAGVVKFDFLGLNTLNDIGSAIKLIRQRHNITIDPHNGVGIDWDDKEVLEELRLGNTDTSFQFGTDIAKSILTKLNVIDTLDILPIVTSLGRKATMQTGMHEEFIKVKNGEKVIHYPHKSLVSILEKTSGIITYQEQVMTACQILGGFSEAEADDVRRAMGKKKKDVMDRYKAEFINNAVSKFDDIDQVAAERLWELLESFSGYGFNASHAVAYALTGYICMFLKTKYPLEWWCGVLMNMDDKSEIAELYPYVKNILVLPSITESGDNYYINSDNKIVIPLSFVKKVGAKVLKEIMEERAKAPFASFEDFHERVPKRVVRVDVIENLILANVFKPLHPELTTHDLLEKLFKLKKKKMPEKYHHMSKIKLIRLEEECMPVNPVDYITEFKDMIKTNALQYEDMDRFADRQSVVTAGIVSEVKFLNTRKGKPMAFMTIRNKDKTLGLTCWEEVINKSKDFMKKGAFIKVQGKINRYRGKTGIVPDLLEFLA